MDAVSDRGLRAFVAAARCGSLTRAARELKLGQPAVSHAIKRVEQSIGANLLTRSRTGVEPTALGEELLREIGPAFESIDAAVRSTQLREGAAIVSISVSTSFATWWLLPRLPDFKRKHPDISLRLITTDSDANVNLADLDLWIPLGIVSRPDVTGTPLCDEALVPVAAPSLANASSWSIDHLLGAPLLHLEERYEPRFDWPRWFAAHGRELREPLPGDRSTDYSLVIQAALDGQGVALGWEHLVRPLVTDGRLVPLTAPVTTGQPFRIFNSTSRKLSADALALRDWLVETMRSSAQNARLLP